MSLTIRLRKEFGKILSAPSRKEGDKYIDQGYQKISEFIDKLRDIKNSATREEGDAKINAMIEGEYSRFSEQLTYILNAAERSVGDEKIDQMVSEFEEIQRRLLAIKNSATRIEGDKQIVELMEFIDNK